MNQISQLFWSTVNWFNFELYLLNKATSITFADLIICHATTWTKNRQSGYSWMVIVVWLAVEMQFMAKPFQYNIRDREKGWALDNENNGGEHLLRRSALLFSQRELNKWRWWRSWDPGLGIVMKQKLTFFKFVWFSNMNLVCVELNISIFHIFNMRHIQQLQTLYIFRDFFQKLWYLADF